MKITTSTQNMTTKIISRVRVFKLITLVINSIGLTYVYRYTS